MKQLLITIAAMVLMGLERFECFFKSTLATIKKDV